MPARYAETTEVPVARSKAAIEQMLIDHGAKKYQNGWSETHDILQFEMFGRTVRFTLPRPDPSDKRFTRDKRSPWKAVSNAQRDARIEQANRQRWRALFLVIRAKIEAVEAGISVFEAEFLAFVVMPNDFTIGDALVPLLKAGVPLPELPMLEAGPEPMEAQ